MKGEPIVIERIRKAYGPVTAVADISLNVEAGEFLSLLGPSGSGKTTLLMMIAGFETPGSGRILLGTRDLTHVPPNKRGVGMVFQRYALFPHLTVWENVAFGLRVGGVEQSEVDRRVEEALASVRLSGFGGRSIDALSGGQQQRVAVARAVINQPALLLLDEPLGALDLKLRKEMQSELRSLQRQLDTAFLYVTHDQEEALAMSDTVVVMREGKVEQIGSPIDLYQRPRSRFVATFVGESNLLAGRNDGGRLELEGLGTVPSPPGPLGTVFLSVRPEDLRLGPGGDSELVGTLADVVFLGATTRYVVRLSDGTLVDVDETRASQADAELGQPVTISWSSTHAVVVPQA
jgi:ABC-type Fe3+/spermidine/putrescine transport system ATPase subunit